MFQVVVQLREKDGTPIREAIFMVDDNLAPRRAEAEDQYYQQVVRVAGAAMNLEPYPSALKSWVRPWTTAFKEEL